MAHIIFLNCTKCSFKKEMCLGSTIHSHPSSTELFCCKKCRSLFCSEIDDFFVNEISCIRVNPNPESRTFSIRSKLGKLLGIEEPPNLITEYLPDWNTLTKPICPDCSDYSKVRHITTYRGLSLLAHKLDVPCRVCEQGMIRMDGSFDFVD